MVVNTRRLSLSAVCAPSVLGCIKEKSPKPTSDHLVDKSPWHCFRDQGVLYCLFPALDQRSSRSRSVGPVAKCRSFFHVAFFFNLNRVGKCHASKLHRCRATNTMNIQHHHHHHHHHPVTTTILAMISIVNSFTSLLRSSWGRSSLRFAWMGDVFLFLTSS
jgi:hypothetical protein